MIGILLQSGAGYSPANVFVVSRFVFPFHCGLIRSKTHFVEIKESDAVRTDRIILPSGSAMSLGFSPFHLVHRRDIQTPLDVILLHNAETHGIIYVQHNTRAKEVKQLEKLHTLDSQATDRRRYDHTRRPIYHRIGNLIWVCTPVRKVGLPEILLSLHRDAAVLFFSKKGEITAKPVFTVVLPLA
ncbi:endonuclease [Caerostris darwini]|uniref:Endonuclease n=1 Tax=Caerostris darwini TaxID=1538125 RepID=A0AAV4WIS1_9ARAC|nr:endonuclease [Caerostris darwini]